MPPSVGHGRNRPRQRMIPACNIGSSVVATRAPAGVRRLHFNGSAINEFVSSVGRALVC